MHRTTGRWKLGFLLALCTALLWGMLPIALKLLLGAMDVYSITWYRFLAAALILGAFVVRRVGLPGPRQLGGAGLWLLLIASLGLTGNYLFYLLGLDYLSPGAAQVVIQLAPMLLLLGGLVISIVLMLNYAIRGLVDIGHPDGESHLIAETDDQELQPA